MTITRYEQVTVQTTKTVPCVACGKKVRRSRTFTNTINPFNRNAEGQIKSRAEVRADVVAEAQVWRDADEKCTACTTSENEHKGPSGSATP